MKRVLWNRVAACTAVALLLLSGVADARTRNFTKKELARVNRAINIIESYGSAFA